MPQAAYPRRGRACSRRGGISPPATAMHALPARRSPRHWPFSGMRLVPAFPGKGRVAGEKARGDAARLRFPGKSGKAMPKKPEGIAAPDSQNSTLLAAPEKARQYHYIDGPALREPRRGEFLVEPAAFSESPGQSGRLPLPPRRPAAHGPALPDAMGREGCPAARGGLPLCRPPKDFLPSCAQVGQNCASMPRFPLGIVKRCI